MSNTYNAALHGRCNRCSKHLEQWRSVLDNLCGLCFAIALDEVQANRRIFQALLDAGVSRKVANIMMIAKVDHDFEQRMLD